jgi:hypothetical protein
VKLRDRTLAAVLLVSGLALAAILFGRAIFAGFVVPMASGIWALLRIFVLSVDQIQLWTFMLIALFLLFALRAALALMDYSPETQEESGEPDENAVLGSVKYWRYMFAEVPRSPRELALARREFAKLLLSSYAAKERVMNDFSLYGDFKSRRIPLPDGIYDFAFADEPPSRGSRLRSWLRRASGADRVEYHRAVEEFLDFIKSYMEISDEE